MVSMRTVQEIEREMDAIPVGEWADVVEDAAKRVSGLVDRAKINRRQARLLRLISNQLGTLAEELDC